MLGKQARIGEWSVEPALDALRRGGETVRLEPKAMELLVALASRPGQVVSREELLTAVWPGVVVGDEALSQAVTKLRKALGDDARAPTYIETISKRGYRLIAGVEPLDSGPAMATPVAGRGRSHFLHLATVGAVLVLLALLIAGMYLLPTARQQAAPLAGPEPRAVTDVDPAAKLPTVAVAPFESLDEDVD